MFWLQFCILRSANHQSTFSRSRQMLSNEPFGCYNRPFDTATDRLAVHAPRRNTATFGLRAAGCPWRASFRLRTGSRPGNGDRSEHDGWRGPHSVRPTFFRFHEYFREWLLPPPCCNIAILSLSFSKSCSPLGPLKNA